VAVTGGQKESKVDLSGRRDLVLHTYDSFLISHTRIYTFAHSVYASKSSEIEKRQRLLFFEDLLNFSITARRLIELTKIRNIADNELVPLQMVDRTEAKALLVPSKETVSFWRMINSVIHCKNILLITNRLDFMDLPAKTEQDMWRLYLLRESIRVKDRWAEFSVDPTVVVEPDRSRMIGIRLRDLVYSASSIAEQVSEVCSASGIFLEFDYRGMD
jgi:hypothetical protein